MSPRSRPARIGRRACIVAAVAVLAALPSADASTLGRVSVLPIQDRVGDPELAARVLGTARGELWRDLDLVYPTGMRDALRRQRIRDAGDTAPDRLRQLGEELGADSFVSVTIHRVQAEPEPQITLSGWALRTEDRFLAWAGFSSASGLDSRRVLGQGRVESLEVLADEAVRQLMAELRSSLTGTRSARRSRRARGGFLAAATSGDERRPVAVAPFRSVTDGRQTLTAETVTALAHAALDRHGVQVLHPGLVSSILRSREGWLMGELDPYSRAALRLAGDLDRILTGTVEMYGFESAGEEPNPRVAFSARVMDVEDGRILWINGQDRTGWDRQKLFRVGRIHDPGTLAEEMMHSMMAGWLQPE